MPFSTYRHNIILFQWAMVFSSLLVACTQLSAECKPPTMSAYSARTTGSIQINWFNTAFNDAWELELVENDDPFTGNPTTPVVTDWFYIFSGLQPGTEYLFNIRPICGDETGDWNGPFYFITSLDNTEACNLDFQMDDATGNDPEDNFFYLMDENFMGKVLGAEVYIQNVELIVEHAWPSDLELILISPSGKQVVLADKQGFNSVNLGLPGANCQNTLLFSDNACLSVDGQSPLNGSFIPEEPFETFYTGDTLNGNWILNIRDHNPGHRGVLKYFRINLVEATCRLPQVTYILPDGPNSCRIFWEDDSHQCDSILVEYGPAGFLVGTGTNISLTEDMNGKVLGGLEPDFAYDFYFRAACGEEVSDYSCPFPFTTSCHTISLRDHFDESEQCALDCQSVCQVSTIWFNQGFPFNQWLVNSGMTASDDTGPNGDITGFGNYIYVESSGNNCGFVEEALLETDCLQFMANGDGCDFSFKYHMHGPDIGKLSFQLSLDDGKTWDEVFVREGEQGNEWHTAVVDLSDYDGLVGRARFQVLLNNSDSDRGDIALDELVFYGTLPVVEAQYLFYPDSDGDNYGDAVESLFFCSNTLVAGFSRNDLDCDDTDASINPDAEEIPCNAIDENCNGMEDDLDLENPMLTQLADLKDETCLGVADGSISLEVQGGQPPYEFLWSNGQTDSILLNVGAGNYACEITDAFGCVVNSDSFSIEAGTSLFFELVDKAIISCGGAKDGSITIDHTGGTAPFTYAWSNGDTTKNIDELSPGVYQVTISDSVGCQVISPEIELIAATNFLVGFDIDNPLCHGQSNGEIKIIGIQNGIPPFTFAWSTGDMTQQITGLEDGFYSLTVTDGSFCYETIDSIEIQEPEPLSADLIAKDDISCYGYKDGALAVNATGGVSPYTFQWTRNGQVISTQDDLFQIGSGIYRLRVRDNNACEYISDPIELSQPDPIEIMLDNIIHADCRASGDGSIEIEVMGGSGSYEYFWNGIYPGDTLFDMLDPGLYNVVVTDRYGCKGFRNGIEVGFLDVPLDVTMQILDNLACFGDSTAILGAAVAEAALPIDFNWSAGVKRIKSDFLDTLSGVPSGMYYLTVTDADGCVGISDVLTISQTAKLGYAIEDIQPLQCADDESGSIQLNLYGGQPPYVLLWDHGAIGEKLLHLDGGYYSAWLLDANDCGLRIDSIYLDEPEPITVEVSATPSFPGLFTGTATVLPEGGTTPYYYQWDEQTGFQTGQTAIQLDTGSYYVTVTDFNMCEKKALVIVPQTTSTTDGPEDISDVSISPNPAVNKQWVSLEVPGLQPEHFALYDLMGRGTSVDWYFDPDQNLYLISIGQLPGGLYLLQIKGKNFEHTARLLIVR